ncbi:Hypothetical Protein FCC1311_015082 [Hondaea fermentalgiana]|uniref:Uncharacterized protein n=1 Tax=Hondaea fermentalgiana TaxID=2315210 RepID=A0A2R5GB14_9STRA|nr:Hypothetical Protein FCC1311_015082 [Hondaea fermentalgiana]|eukprot:GBG25291.1 Hypothetical Protein FCC1311_015082 [Hondaea fermentalgiana]
MMDDDDSGRQPLLGTGRQDSTADLEDAGAASADADNTFARGESKGVETSAALEEGLRLSINPPSPGFGAGHGGSGGDEEEVAGRDEGSMTSMYASFHEVGSDGSHTPRRSLEGTDLVESVSAAASGLPHPHEHHQEAEIVDVHGQDPADQTRFPSSSISTPEQATGHSSAEQHGVLVQTPSHMFESCSESEDEFGPSYRNLLHEYEVDQRQAAAVREALRAQEGSMTCSFIRRHKCAFCALITALIVASGVVATLCWFRPPTLSITESHLRFDSLSERQTLNGTQVYMLQNPNYLSLALEHLSVTVYYYSHTTHRWYQFDETGDDISESLSVTRHGSAAFTAHFSYRIRSARVASAILMQCVDGHVDLAFRGYAGYRFLGQTITRDFGPDIRSSDCILTSTQLR